MNFKRLLCISTFIFSCAFLNAQEKVYLDENMNQIDSIIYKRKCSLYPYKCINYKTDSINLFKIGYKYQFGKLDTIAYNQIRKLLVRDSKKQVSKNNVIVIKFYDSLRTYERAYELHVEHMKKHHQDEIDSLNKNFVKVKHRGLRFDKEVLQKNRENFVKRTNKCINKFESKLDVSVFYLYKDDSNISDQYKNFNWVEDTGIFKRVFFKIMMNYGILVIKPDGEYFLIGSCFSDKNLKKLISNHDWSKYKEEWDLTINKYKSSGKGMFKNKSSLPHKKHCF